MTYVEFYNLLPGGWYDTVVAKCHVEGCQRSEELKKGSALVNFKRNGKFICRSCAYTVEGRKKISKATSYKRSPETKKKMSKSANRKWKTPWGKEHRKTLSRLGAEQQATHKASKSKIKGYYPSAKTGKLMAYNSSYELYRCYLLDNDPSVKTYDTQVAYEGIYKWHRSMDFLIEFNDGTIQSEEVKPKKRLHEELHELQIEDTKQNAKKNGWKFAIITEDELGMTGKEMMVWALDFRKQFDGIDLEEFYKEKNKERYTKYNKKSAKERVINFFCAYCKEIHTRAIWNYERNVKKNGRFICHSESAHKSKNKKVNPYAKQGKKQCNLCGRILPFDCFWRAGNSSDGHEARCIECKKGLTDASKSKKPTFYTT